MSSPRVSIIVRCYNEAEHIGKLLHGISEQTEQDHEVVLVDSGSTDGTLEIAEEFGVDKIEYIEPANFSFGRALNYGCRAAAGKFLLLASAHVYPRRNDWIERLVEKFDEETALVYGKQRGNDVTTFSENQIFKQWFPEHDIEHQPHPFCNNANAAVRRELWEEYPYDEHLTGLEDVDWAKRIQKAGYEIAYASDAEIIHVHDETSSEVLNRYQREAYAHKEIIPEHSFSFIDFLRFSVQNIFSDYSTAAAEGKLTSNLLEILKFRLMQFWGTYRGFNNQGPISDDLWQRFYYPNRDSYPPDNTASEESESPKAAEIDYSERSEIADVQQADD